jgi:hypothetical protein
VGVGEVDGLAGGDDPDEVDGDGEGDGDGEDDGVGDGVGVGCGGLGGRGWLVPVPVVAAVQETCTVRATVDPWSMTITPLQPLPFLR